MKQKFNFNSGLIKQYFIKRRYVLCVYLFGSCAKNKQNLYSDIDLAILVSNRIRQDRYSDLQIEIMNDLSEVIKRELDIVVLNQASPFLKFQIIRNGIKILDKRKVYERSFELRTFMEYFDFLPVKNFLEANLIHKIKEV